MSLMGRLLPDNPVLTKELRVRMRGARAYWILLGYLGFLAAVLLINYGSWLSRVNQSGIGSSEASRLGSDIFNWIIVTQVFLVLFITPAITSGSLTIEREQQTIDLLTLTRLPRRSIIAGKLLSAVSFTALLLISSLPIVSICFMLGSVDPAMVFSSYMMMLMGSLAIGAMGLMWSSIARTTTQAVMYTYGTLFLLFIAGSAMYGFNITPFHTGNPVEISFTAAGATWFGTRFLGIPVPEGTGFAILCLVFTFVVCANAMTRLEMYPERKGLLMRSLTLLLVGLQVLAANVWWLDAWSHRLTQTRQVPVPPPIGALFITATLLMLLVPVFATGELEDSERRRFWPTFFAGWNPKNLRIGKMMSGLPFLLLLTAACLALYALPFVMTGKTKDMLGTSIQTHTITPQGSYSLATPYPAQQPFQQTVQVVSGNLPHAALTLFASVLGFGLFCQFLSVLFRNRWIGWLFANIFLVVMWVVPALACSSASPDMPPGFSVNLHYLNPAQVIYQMCAYNPNNQYLLYGQSPLWRVTTTLWLSIGALSLLLTAFVASRERKRVAVSADNLATA